MPIARRLKPVAVRLEQPLPRHRIEFIAAVRRSVRLHEKWVKPPRTAPQYQAFLDRLERPANVGYFIRGAGDDLVGVAVITEIVRGAFKSAYLGYYAFEPHAGHGQMRGGLALVIARAFGRHRLHRIEANIQPANTRSIELVRSLGFRLEGYSPRYLKVAGRWRDHERWAMTVEDWRSGGRR